MAHQAERSALRAQIFMLTERLSTPELNELLNKTRQMALQKPSGSCLPHDRPKNRANSRPGLVRHLRKGSQ